MKNIKFILLCFYFYSGLNIQTACSQVECFEMTSIQSHALFAGIKNPLNFSIGSEKNFMQSKYILSSASGKVFKENGKWMIIISKEWIDKIISIHVIDTFTFSKVGDSVNFLVKRISSPFAKLNGNILGGSLSKTQLINSDSVVCSLDDIYLSGLIYRIISFEVVRIDSKNHKQAVNNDGAVFNEGVLKLFNSLKPGETILFRNIKCLAPDGFIRNLNSISVFIGNDLRDEVVDK